MSPISSVKPPPVKPATIRDVAREAGMSIGTVSRILNGGNKEVWPGTAQRARKVRQIARKLGYVPNQRAVRLVQRRSNCVGLLYARSGLYRGDLYYRFMASATKRLTNAGFDLMLIPVLGPFEQWSAKLNDQRVDACLVMPPMPRGLDDLLQAKQHVPLVMVNLEVDLAVPQVLFDETQGMRLAVEHLAGLGHQRIAWHHRRDDAGEWKDEVAHHSYEQRKRAFETLAEELIPAGKHWIAEEKAEILVRRVAERPDENPTAVVTYTDRDALELIRAAWKTGLRVPEDLSIIGYNDSLFAQYTTPALTSIGLPIVEAAEVAVDMLLEDLEDPSQRRYRVERLPQYLATRETTCPPAGVRAGRGRVH